jgi:poly-beta-1,6-N-acetyl-D-glucosamine synthase
MNGMAVCFWLSVACVVYAYAGYPLLLALLAKIRPRPVRTECFTGRTSIVVAAYNEQASIRVRLSELISSMAASGIEGEIIVVSDGSTDHTAEIAREFERSSVRVLELPSNRGKAAALDAGCVAAQNEIIVFADTRQSWTPGTLSFLLENFLDARVGAVSGDLVLERAPGVLAGVGLYWRYEKWVRRLESDVYSTVGVTGAISAVRRVLFRPIPQGTLLDDVYWPLQVAMQGFRVIHESRAKANDVLPDRVSDEFRRKVRTLCGNYQLLTRLPSALLPWRNPIWFQFYSHKVLRLIVPWAFLIALVSSFLLDGLLYQFAFGAQVAMYGISFAGLFSKVARRSRLVTAVSSFLMLNMAAWVAFWVWCFGGAAKSWSKADYRALPLLTVKAMSRTPQ